MATKGTHDYLIEGAIAHGLALTESGPIDTAAMRNRDEPSMHSACGEYGCPCHFDLPRCLDEIDALRASHAELLAACQECRVILCREIEMAKALRQPTNTMNECALASVEAATAKAEAIHA